MAVNSENPFQITGETETPLGLLVQGRFRELFNRHYALVLFVLIFLVPTSLSVAYACIASGRYVSETQFIVRGVNSAQAGALSSLLRTFGLSRSNDDSYAIESYILSRDALRHLDEKVDLAAVYSRPGADFMTRFRAPQGEGRFEALYRYYEDQVKVIRDFETGITTLSVSAYTAEDARQISQTLLLLGEARVNEMNERSRRDLLALTENTLKEAEARVVETQLDLTRFRISEMNVDFEKAAANRVDMLTNLFKQLAGEEVRLRQMQEASPDSPALARQKRVVSALKEQTDQEQAKLAGSSDGLAEQLGVYEPLVLKKEMAQNAYEVAVRSLNQAREEARRKQIYLEPIVKPNLPDEATEPQRIRSIFTVALLTFASYVMIYLLVSGSREHLNLH